MICDSKEQKDLLMACINSVQVNGSMVEKFYELKQSVSKAEVKEISNLCP